MKYYIYYEPIDRQQRPQLDQQFIVHANKYTDKHDPTTDRTWRAFCQNIHNFRTHKPLKDGIAFVTSNAYINETCLFV